MKHKPTYQELEKENKILREHKIIINRSPYVIFLWKNQENWPVEFVSENAQNIFGYSSDEFMSEKNIYYKLIHPDDLQRVREEISKNNSESFVHKPYRILNKTDEIKWVKGEIYVRRDTYGKITHYDGIITDITKQIQAKETENAELLGVTNKRQSQKESSSNSLPKTPYKSENIKNKEKKTAKSKNKPNILIVEDEETNYLYLESLLKDKIELDCQILHVVNGKEAVEMCENYKNIDLVLMDIKMPVMNGFEATKKIKEFRPDLPIVVQTAYIESEDRAKAFLVGCDDFISKPISEISITKIINEYLVLK